MSVRDTSLESLDGAQGIKAGSIEVVANERLEDFSGLRDITALSVSVRLNPNGQRIRLGPMASEQIGIAGNATADLEIELRAPIFDGEPTRVFVAEEELSSLRLLGKDAAVHLMLLGILDPGISIAHEVPPVMIELIDSRIGPDFDLD